MKNVYLLLAIVGAIVPYLFLGPWFAAAGIDLGGFLGAAFGNRVSAGLTADLLISSAVFWVLMGANGDARRVPWLIAVNVLIGLSCALPAYLYLQARDRERHAAAAPAGLRAPQPG